MSTKGTNPKDAIGIMKAPLHLVSPIAKAYQAVAHYLGNVKYGAWNWRAAGARASVYYAAQQRHMDKWWEGQEYDPADGTHHLANALACINILIECRHSDNLVDDRPPSRCDALEDVYAEVERMMASINARYADRSPRHYTIEDTHEPFPGIPAELIPRPEGYGPPVVAPEVRNPIASEEDALAAARHGSILDGLPGVQHLKLADVAPLQKRVRPRRRRRLPVGFGS